MICDRENWCTWKEQQIRRLRQGLRKDADLCYILSMGVKGVADDEIESIVSRYFYDGAIDLVRGPRLMRQRYGIWPISQKQIFGAG